MPNRAEIDLLVRYINKLRRACRLLGVLGGVALVLAGGGLVYGYLANSARINENNEARVALCSLKEDLAQRVGTTTNFLRDHPTGIFGIPLRIIQDQLKNQKRTVDSLSSLKC